MRPFVITRQLDAADADGIAQAQTLGGAGDLTLNGAFVSGGVATLDAQRAVAIESTADLSAITFTVYGTNQSGIPFSEEVTGPNNNSVYTNGDFLTVTRVSADGAVGTNVEVGTNNLGNSPPFFLDRREKPFQVSLVAEFEGTVTCTVQYTLKEGLNQDVDGSIAAAAIWFDHADLTNISANDNGSMVSPVQAIRVRTTSGAGTVTIEGVQS